MALLITITNAGRAEIINAQNTGTEKVTITAVALGTGQYTPSKTQSALQAEVKRVGSIAGQAVAADTIHVMAMDESTAAYNVGEFGLISDKGTLIAVYSQLPAAGWIIQKAATSTLLLATDIILESLDTSVIEFGDITFINPPATASVAGVTKLVNTLTSTDTTSALTAAMGKKLQDEKQANIAAGSTAQYWRGDKTWRDFATDVRAAVLTGLSTASAAAVAASDSVLSALGKLQAQVTGLATSKLDATANAVSATKLQTARTINGVAFDGSSNITVADNSKLPLEGGKLTGGLEIAYSAPIVTFTETDQSDKKWFLVADGGDWSVRENSTATLRFTIREGGVVQCNGGGIWNLNASSLAAGVVPDARLSGTYTGVNITGNAGSATKLQTSRDIGGVAFDGTASINLPGVNAAGNQNTSGNAATATKLQTARTINGVAFDGTGNITIDGAPPGTVGHFAMVTPPTGWLKANGAAVSRTTYAALFAAIGTTFGAGNGSTTFNLPDLRGEFLRGWDDGRGVDSGRAFGSTQADELKSHSHNFSVYSTDPTGAYAADSDGAGLVKNASTATTGGSETRPRNIALLACIKF